MNRKLLSNKRYWILSVVIALVLMLAASAVYQGNQNKLELSDQIAVLNESLVKVQEENEKLKQELAESERERSNSVLSNQTIKEEIEVLKDSLKKTEESLLKVQEEKEALEKLLKEKNQTNDPVSSAPQNTPAENSLFIHQGLVRVKDIDSSVVVELKYATEDNFTHTRVYPADAKALLRLETAKKLKKANDRFKKDGYRIKIWDAYRPKSVQEIFWALVPDPKYVANPAKGSAHNRGASVDITLVDSTGKELVMPTDYDDFSEKASRNFTGSDDAARENMKYMEKIMTESGFTGLPSEWWHFDDKSGNYPLLDVDFSVFN